jgi:hypothetical protein
LAKRVVQTTKRGLRKYGQLRGSHLDWDLMLPWIAMGHRFKRHASLGNVFAGAGSILLEGHGDLSIAQHRDTLRYACIRSGTYQP